MTGPSDVILKLSKSVIRRYRNSDAEAIVEAADSPQVSAYMMATFPSPYTLQDAVNWIEIAGQEGSLFFAICTPDSDIVIGGCGFQHLTGEQSRTKVLGYWLSPKYWGQGIMTEVIATLSHWAFEQVPTLLRIEATVFKENRRSIKVLERAGYHHEGIRRMAAFKNGRAYNTVSLGLIRHEGIGLVKEKTDETA
ncbi:acyl-CoA N-acyltransferase [Trichoderma citrinoviride]|uniref:Acyl-CoA N-acyltransferase n=1 Tax=Trichoderma citrinoviride TaxID=58853 RepID=A0A2T4AYF3_9HYPO|nr:acyl-CoA N-acyltransferase [Trichoderma citrinoviride]PTB62104.1 acyl-CoA N-acyltransferase [Trichoderma citrinoviride]